MIKNDGGQLSFAALSLRKLFFVGISQETDDLNTDNEPREQ